MANPTPKLIPIVSNIKQTAVIAFNAQVDTSTIHLKDYALKWMEAVRLGMKQMDFA